MQGLQIEVYQPGEICLSLQIEKEIIVVDVKLIHKINGDKSRRMRDKHKLILQLEWKISWAEGGGGGGGG